MSQCDQRLCYLKQVFCVGPPLDYRAFFTYYFSFANVATDHRGSILRHFCANFLGFLSPHPLISRVMLAFSTESGSRVTLLVSGHYRCGFLLRGCYGYLPVMPGLLRLYSTTFKGTSSQAHLLVMS